MASRIERMARERRYMPSSLSQRRSARDYRRRSRSPRTVARFIREDGIQLAELSAPERHDPFTIEDIESSLPQIRLHFGDGLSLGEMRRRREILVRNEILRRILTQIRSRESSRHVWQTQLHFLRAAMSGQGGRDFTGEDYETLS